MRLFKLVVVCLFFNLTACTHSPSQPKVVAGDPANSGVYRLAKSGTDEDVEIHQRIVMGHLKRLMTKLYKRNPSIRHDKQVSTIEDSVELVFSKAHDDEYSQWRDISAADLVSAALKPEFKGQDRILAFIVGLRKMLMASYDNHTEFYYLTSIDQQKLYNSARNIEVAAWLLAESKNEHGQHYLLSDSLENERRNLSYQRLFGQMIATQDNLATIVSHKTGRLIKTVVVKAASLVFIPI